MRCDMENAINILGMLEIVLFIVAVFITVVVFQRIASSAKKRDENIRYPDDEEDDQQG
jgi:hypothetical protein